MGTPTRISELLRSADSLGAALAVLTRECPHLTIESVLAVERAQIVELGWRPSRNRRDSSWFVTLAALLRPVAAVHGNLPLAQALRLVAESGHRRAGEVARALAVAEGSAQPLPIAD